VKPLVLLSAAAGLCACTGAPGRSAPTPAPVAAVRIDGSAGVMPLVAALAREYRALEPAVAIEMGGGMGTKARVDALAQERIDIALASHGVVREEMASRGIAMHEIARVAVVFGVNASVPVTSLTRAQICDVYSGATTNWSRLGGPDVAIAARTRPVAEVDADVVSSGIACFKGALAPAAAMVVEKPEEMAAALATTRGAIGMTSMPFVQQSDGRIRAVALDGVTPSAESIRSGGYALSRASYLLTRATPAPAVARFLAFVRGPAGARIIIANGGVPVE
jgi:phosphate transport system substrate-binding protein